MSEEAVKRDMTIGDVVKKFPVAAEVFMEYGLHCVGCHVSYWETIEEGARGHGMSDEEIDMMVRDANTLIASPKHTATDSNDVHLTQSAIEKVKSFMQEDEKDAFFRIGLAEGGCSGYSYVFSIDKVAKNDDVHFVAGDLKVIVAPAHMEHLRGAIVDYVETLQESGFKVRNPNAQHTCGCGSSFS